MVPKESPLTPLTGIAITWHNGLLHTAFMELRHLLGTRIGTRYRGTTTINLSENSGRVGTTDKMHFGGWSKCTAGFD